MAAVILKGSASELHFVDAVGTGTFNLTSVWTDGAPSVSHDQVDVMAFGDDAHRNRQGLESADLSFTFLHDSTATLSYGIMKALYSSTSARNIIYAPDGTASGKPKLQFPARLFSMTWGGGVGDALTIAVTFGIDGSATLGAY
jgi:hypothetical protein